MKVFGWHIGQELYTASDIKLQPSEIGRNDHPYAGWLFCLFALFNDIALFINRDE